MSQHVIIQGPTKVGENWEDIKWVFGWDQMLMTFYLQKHDGNRPDEDDRIILWLGAGAESKMYEVEELVAAARKHGLDISHELQVELYREKDEGA